ncbi:DUF3540 domain-containing protein [Bordetella petrii]|uniref:DUF3540 domain-containing protein n=1 Tax=Bordetella petrii TaxID=94624 RepID=UPI003733283B
MNHRQRDNGIPEEAACGTDGDAGPLDPLLQKPANSFSGDIHVHSAFLVDAHDSVHFTVSNREHGRQYRVKRAASCLLMPEPGDKVLVSGDAAGGLYIIAVLEQGAGGRANLRVDGELALSADRLSLTANDRVAIATDAFSLKARSGAIEAADWAVESQRYTLASVELDVAAMTARYTGDQRESYFRSVSETTGRSARYVTGTDTVKAINLDYAADFIARLSGNTTLINGETLVKADGKQILVG